MATTFALARYIFWVAPRNADHLMRVAIREVATNEVLCDRRGIRFGYLCNSRLIQDELSAGVCDELQGGNRLAVIQNTYRIAIRWRQYGARVAQAMPGNNRNQAVVHPRRSPQMNRPSWILIMRTSNASKWFFGLCVRVLAMHECVRFEWTPTDAQGLCATL